MGKVKICNSRAELYRDSVKDDEEAVDIATSIFEYAYRYRENLNRFKIFVRLRKSMREDFLCMHKEFFDIIIPFGSVKRHFPMMLSIWMYLRNPQTI